MGISFITYLTDYRMQQAVHLMLETNEKNYELQNMLAMRTQTILDMFLNANNGMSPSKYRTEHMGK